MIKNMKIALILMFMGAMASSGIIATAARSAGMGITQANSWAVEGQLPYFYTNPAEIGYFGPMIFGETTGAITTSNGGILFKPAETLNIGVFAGQRVDTSEIVNVHGNAGTLTDITSLALSTPVFGFSATHPTALTLLPSTIFSSPTSALANQNASIIAQLNLGNLALGAGFSYGATSNKVTSNNTTPVPAMNESLSLSDSSINAVVGAVFKLDKIKFDASVAYRPANVNNVYTYSDTTNSVDGTFSYKSKGAGDIIIDAQGIFDLNNNILHVMAGYDILNGSSVSNSSVTTSAGKSTTQEDYNNTGTNFRVGISDEIRFSKDIFAFVGASLNLMNTKTSTPTWTSVVNGGTATTSTTTSNFDTVKKSTITTLPVFMGMEANLGENWQARFGLGANLLNINPAGSSTTNSQSTPSAISNSSSATTWNNAAPTFATGLSFKIAHFAFDWNIAIPLLTNGPNFIGGGAPGLASAFAVSYKFGDEKSETSKK